LPAAVVLVWIQTRSVSLGAYGLFPSPVHVACNKMCRYLR
jgi:hypothetical protein